MIHVWAGEHDDARAAAEDGLRQARTLANPSILIVTLWWFAWTRRPDESNDTIAALEECLAHSHAVATPDAVDVLHALGLFAKLRARRGERTRAIEALRDAITRTYDTGQPLQLFSFALTYGVSVAADLDAPEFAATLGAALTDGPLAGLASGRPRRTRRPRCSPRPRPRTTRPRSLRRQRTHAVPP